VNYVRVSVSPDLPIPLETVKSRLQIEDTGDATYDAAQDEAVTQALRAAVDYVEAQTHLTLRPTVFRLDMRNWCVAIGHGGREYGWSCCYGLNLERVPVQSVDQIEFLGRGEITYDDLPEADWSLQRTASGGVIHLTDGVSLPSLEARWNAVRITFTAGFEIDGVTGSGDDPELALPAGLGQALTLLAGHFFTNRDAVGTERQYEVQIGADALMTAFRLYR
jgi:uncharacterized phiE125 gp8 family phage protein